MRLNDQTQKALRALVALAHHGRTMTTEELANSYDISTSSLGRILRQLQARGWISCQRGRHGGVVLIKPSTEITVADVLYAFDTIADTDVIKLVNDPDSHGDFVTMQSKFDELSKQFMAALAGITIASLCNR